MSDFNIRGFAAGPRPRPHSFVTYIQGLPKTGKTTLALTAPGPLAIINLDDGLDGVKAYTDRADVHVARYSVPSLFACPDDETAKEVFGPIVSAIQENCVAAVNAGARTLVIDTMSEYTEMAKMVHLGISTHVDPRFHEVYNAHMRNMLRDLVQAAEGKTHLVFLFQAKHEWGQRINEKTGKLQGAPLTTADGQPVYTRVGWKYDGYFYQLNLETKKIPSVRSESGRVVKPRRFQARVIEARDNESLADEIIEGEDLTLPTIWTMASATHDWSV